MLLYLLLVANVSLSVAYSFCAQGLDDVGAPPMKKWLAGERVSPVQPQARARQTRYGAGFSVGLPVRQYNIGTMNPVGSGVGVQAYVSAL
jgi:hypothetical protein